MTFTETTWKLVCSLEKRGHNIRDIINAGIVLFDAADTNRKWEAHLRAYSNIPEDVKDLERRLEAAKKDLKLYYVQPLSTEHIELTWDCDEQKKVIVKPSDGSLEGIKQHLGPEEKKKKKSC